MVPGQLAVADKKTHRQANYTSHQLANIIQNQCPTVPGTNI